MMVLLIMNFQQEKMEFQPLRLLQKPYCPKIINYLSSVIIAVIDNKTALSFTQNS